MIRFATLSDLESLLAYQKEEGRSFMPERALKSSCKDHSLLIAVDKSAKVQGFLKFHKEQDSIRIVYLHSAQSSRRQGIGKELLKTILDSADEDGKMVSLSVSPSNRGAISLYTKFGFVTDPRAELSPDPLETSKPMIRQARLTV